MAFARRSIFLDGATDDCARRVARPSFLAQLVSSTQSSLGREMSKSTKFALDVYRRQDQLISSRPRGLTLRKTRKKNKKSKRRPSGGILYNKQAMAKQLKHMIEVLERSDGGRKRECHCRARSERCCRRF